MRTAGVGTASHHLREWARTMLAHHAGGNRAHHDRHAAHEVFQTSTIGALLAGVYEGDVTVRELLTHGGFGLGTFDGLDGEMVVLDGVCHRVRADGSAHVADPGDHTPFAVVTDFVAEASSRVRAPITRAELCARFDALGTTDNLIYAVRATGRFSRVRTRSVVRQVPPYPPLVEATEHEPITECTDLTGTVVGFRTPEYEQGISVTGYHLHFLDASRTRGGHVLDLTLQEGELAVSSGSELHLHLPRTGAFTRADLRRTDADAVRRVEGDRA